MNFAHQESQTTQECMQDYTSKILQIWCLKTRARYRWKDSMIRNLHGNVFSVHKGERIHNHPLHVNLEVVAFKVWLDLLENVGIIKVEKQHNPIRGQKLLRKIKNGNNAIPPFMFQRGIFRELEAKRARRFLRMPTRTRLTLFTSLTCTWSCRHKNRRRGEGQDLKESKRIFF